MTLWGFVEKITAYMVEIIRELELEVESEDVTEWLQSHEKNLMESKWFLEIESTSGEAIVKTGEMATKNLERDINLVDRAMARFERTNADFEGGSTVGRI